MKRPIITERMFLYWTDREHPNTCRMTVRMQDAIELTMMQEALRQTQTRYPYYSVRLGLTSDEHGHEHYEYEDNPAPWVLNTCQEPVELFGEASYYHQVAFACWDDCVAIDFFHGLMDGTGAYNVLRTLMYEYCRRRYDASLSSKGIRKAGETIDESEWIDPASLPKPELHALPVPPLPKAINLITDAVSPLRERYEVINILVTEQQLMDYVRRKDTSPATLMSLLMARAINQVHPESKEAVPVVTMGANQRPAIHAAKACQSITSAVFLALTDDIRHADLETQQTTFRGITLLQNDTDTMAARFWQSKEGADRVDQMPTVAARHEVMKGLTQRTQTMTSCFISYVGKANFGAAERYIREMYTEVYSTHALGAEISAIGGTFCISFMQLFTTDVYLDAFLDELRQLGIDCRIVSRHPILVAPVADYRKKDTLTLK